MTARFFWIFGLGLMASLARGESKEALGRFLDDFYLPEFELTDATLAEGVEQLQGAIAKWTVDPQDSVLRRLPIEQPEQDEAVGRITVELKNKSVRSVLNAIALSAGCKVELGDVKIRFQAIGESGDDSITKKYAVPPTFLENAVGADGEKLPPSGKLSSLFEAFGAGVSAKEVGGGYAYVAATSMLVAESSPDHHQRVETLVDSVTGGVPRQLLIWTKLIEMPAELAIDTQTLREAEYQLYLRFLAQKKATEIVTAPSIVTRWGQSCQVEVIREINYADKNGKVRMYPLGIQIEFDPAREGEHFRLSGKVKLNQLKGGDENWRKGFELEPHERPNWSEVHVAENEFVRHHTPFEFLLEDGMSAALPCESESGPGKKVIMLLKITEIDPSGRRVHREDKGEKVTVEKVMAVYPKPIDSAPTKQRLFPIFKRRSVENDSKGPPANFFRQ